MIRNPIKEIIVPKDKTKSLQSTDFTFKLPRKAFSLLFEYFYLYRPLKKNIHFFCIKTVNFSKPMRYNKALKKTSRIVNKMFTDENFIISLNCL